MDRIDITFDVGIRGRQGIPGSYSPTLVGEKQGHDPQLGHSRGPRSPAHGTLAKVLASGGVAGHWLLVGRGQVPIRAEATLDGRAVHIVADGDVFTFEGSLEEAVRQTKSLRTLSAGTDWDLTTDLDSSDAASLLGRPAEDIDGVTINGTWWERVRMTKARF